MRGAFAAVALVAAALVAGCGGGSSEDGGGSGADAKPVTVTVGTLPVANAAPMYLGMEKGFFEEEKLTIKPQVGEGGAVLIPQLVSGSSQFAFVGVIPAITAVAKKVPIKIVSASETAAAVPEKDWQTLVVPEGSSIKSVKDLPGKTIGVNALRGLAEVVIRRSLEKQGVDPDSVKFTEIPFPDMPAALDAKRVDAALLTEPFLSQMLAKGATQIDAPSVQTRKRFPNGVYVTSDKYLAENEGVVDRFVRAMDKSVDYAQAHPDEVRAIIPTFTKIPKAAAAKIRLPPFDSKIDRPGIQAEAELTKKFGIIDEAPSEEDLIR